MALPVQDPRLVSLVVKETGLSRSQIECQLIPLDRLPLDEFKHNLACYYDEAAHVMATYVRILRQIRELLRTGITLDHPYASEALRKELVRLESRGAEIDNSGGCEEAMRLACVDDCGEGLFILRFRKLDPSSKSGLAPEDWGWIFIDTAPGRIGTLAFAHTLSQP